MGEFIIFEEIERLRIRLYIVRICVVRVVFWSCNEFMVFNNVLLNFINLGMMMMNITTIVSMMVIYFL